MALIISLDPGGTTGVAIAEHVTGRDFQLLHSLEFPWEARFKIFNLIYTNRTRIKALVIEEFRLFENKTTLHSQINSEMPSARVIGIIELSAQICKLNCITFQKPSQRLNVTVLPQHKALIKRSRHCIDAYLHLRYFVLSNARKIK